VSEPKNRWLAGPRIDPGAIRPEQTAADLMDSAFLAYNAGKLQRAARVLVEKMLTPECCVGVALSGALTPAGLGGSAIVPLMRAGFIDWIVSTGANLYHDAHWGLGLALHRGTHQVDDVVLHADGVVRIYDILFEFGVLLKTDAFLREVMEAPEFQREMSTAELHHLLGKYLAAREDELGLQDTCILSTAYRCGVPIYVASPGDSSIGLNMADLWLKRRGPRIDVSRDVNETSAIVYSAKRDGGTSGVLILGLQDEGHDYFVQITDARPDTGGLSGATPSEAVSWGKVDPARLPDSVVVYTDSTIALPLLTAYALARAAKRSPRRLYEKREAMLELLRADYLARQARGGGDGADRAT